MNKAEEYKQLAEEVKNAQQGQNWELALVKAMEMLEPLYQTTIKEYKGYAQQGWGGGKRDIKPAHLMIALAKEYNVEPEHLAVKAWMQLAERDGFEVIQNGQKVEIRWLPKQ
jgi:hypothetical protein